MNKEQLKGLFLDLNLANETIVEVIDIDEMIHVGIVSHPDDYIVLDCHEDYIHWWTNNKATDDCFIIEEEYERDGYTSKSRYLDTSIDIFTVEYFEEYVRHITGLQIMQFHVKADEFYNVDLVRVLTDLEFLKTVAGSHDPDDLIVNFQRIRTACKRMP